MTSMTRLTTPCKPVETTSAPLTGLLSSALGQKRLDALAAYPDEAARIERGYALALAGAVTLACGNIAYVRSHRDPQLRYTVNGHCTCYDAQRAPGGRCKHRWAKALVIKARALLDRWHKEPAAPQPTPYSFPHYRTFLATYCGPQMSACNGTAVLMDDGRFSFTPDGQDSGMQCSYTDVALGPGLDAA